MSYLNISKIYSELSEIKSLISVANSEFIGIEDAAQFLGLKKSYLYKLIHEGKIPFYKPNGKKVYFDKLELRSWISGSKNKSVEELEADYNSSQFLTAAPLTSKKQVGQPCK